MIYFPLPGFPLALPVDVLRDQVLPALEPATVQEIILGETEAEYQLVTVPPMVWNGFQCISDDPAIIANCASIPHAPDEAERMPLDTSNIEYTW